MSPRQMELLTRIISLLFVSLFDPLNGSTQAPCRRRTVCLTILRENLSALVPLLVSWVAPRKSFLVLPMKHTLENSRKMQTLSKHVDRAEHAASSLTLMDPNPKQVLYMDQVMFATHRRIHEMGTTNTTQLKPRSVLEAVLEVVDSYHTMVIWKHRTYVLMYLIVKMLISYRVNCMRIYILRFRTKSTLVNCRARN